MSVTATMSHMVAAPDKALLATLAVAALAAALAAVLDLQPPVVKRKTAAPKTASSEPPTPTHAHAHAHAAAAPDATADATTPTSTTPNSTHSPATEAPPRPPTPFMNRERHRARLASKTPLSHDTVHLRFALPAEDARLGLPVGRHIKLYHAHDDDVERCYTPTSAPDAEGYFDLVVKVYRACDAFPQGGRMSTHLGALDVGDSVAFSGPYGLIEYLGAGAFRRGRSEAKVRRVAMIVGGSGITPAFQVAQAVLSNPNDPTHLSLLYANKTEHDVLLRRELEELAAAHPDRFHVWFALTQQKHDPKEWPYDTGRITRAMCDKHLPAGSSESIALLCGPKGLIEEVCKPTLKAMGYERVWEF